jgi:branched-chain amino acid transport system substrate-binding protein
MKVLSVAAPGNLELVAPDDRKYIISAWGTSGYAASLVLAYFKDELKVKRMGMITTSDSIGEIVANEISGIAKLVGIEMVSIVSQPATDRDLLPSLRKLATLSPKIDAMMVFGSGPFGNIAVNQTEMAGLNIPIGYVGGNVIPELIKDVGPDIGKRTYLVTQRVTAANSIPKEDPYYAVVTKFVTDYQARYNEPATLPTAVGYDMAMTVVNALKAVGPDPEKIRDHVYNNQKGMIGAQGVTFNRTPAYAYGTDPMDNTVVNIEGGKFVFKSYLKDSFKRLGVSDEALRNQMKEFKLILE